MGFVDADGHRYWKFYLTTEMTRAYGNAFI